MKKTDKWYKGNRGLLIGRSGREASVAGEYNPKNKVVCCKGCGKDTTDADMLCEDCK